MRTHKTIEEWIEEGNLWKKMEVKKSINVQQYGRDAGKVHYPTNLWTNSISAPTGMKLEFRNIQTGKIKKIGGTSTYFKEIVEKEDTNWYDEKQFPIDEEINLDDFTDVMQWTQPVHYGNKKPGVYVPCDDVEFRIEDKLLRYTWWVMNTVQVGDFVKCTGTRSGDWNKVESINLGGTPTIFGPKYSKPEEGKMRYASSDNAMVKIKRIIRDGKEILPPK